MPNQQQPQRKSPSMPNYDYAQHGAYFITICTYERKYLLGHIDNEGIMHCNIYGDIVRD